MNQILIKFIYIRKIRTNQNHQLLINKRESTGLNYFHGSKAFIEYSIGMNVIYKNIEEYNRNKKRKMLMAFDDLISDMLCNKKLNPVVTELYIGGRKFNISLVFITQFYFAVKQNFRLNSTHYFVMKNPKQENINKLHFI